ncbi:MAG: PIN domain nuclease [Aerococcus sp.]|nr:PIN domain nuclease [Aerococcus sp.]
MKLKRDSRLWDLLLDAIALVLGVGIGSYLMPVVWGLLHITNPWINNVIVNSLIGLLIFAVIIYLLRPLRDRIVDNIETTISTLSLSDILLGAAGIALGLILAWLVNIPLVWLNKRFISDVIPVIITVLFATLGFTVMHIKADDVRRFFDQITGIREIGRRLMERENEEDEQREKTDPKALKFLSHISEADEHFQPFKILDTSAIIDGRILDVLNTGFLEGVIVVPNFVLKELQYIADSADASKRVRGRRGLDILNAIQELEDVPVEFYSGDFDEEEVDLKLLLLAQEIDGVVVTNDFNLNKVSQFHGIKVLNVNELANSLKIIVIPGDEMDVKIIKSGTERQQGVGYLDDGTMIVVEEGRRHLDEVLHAEVTSVIQTNAGKMIFARIKR